jgi:hypothetical protein
MGRINFRDAYELDPYGAQRAGGLLGLLQAMMQQGQAEAGADFNPQNPGSQTPTIPEALDYGQTPRTRITVRPFDAYSPHDPETEGGEAGLLGRLLALQAEQSRYQPTAGNSGQTPFAPPDPNFRQLSRAPIAMRPQGEIAPFNPSDDRSNPSFSPFGDSTSPRASRQGGQAAQPDASLFNRLQAYWEHPHPYGLVSMLKEALNGMEQAVQGSIAATSVPSTEEEAFRQNQARELGPIGAWKAVSLLAPMSPGRAGRILARPFGDGLRKDVPWPPGPRLTGQGIDGSIANTSAWPVRSVSRDPNLSPALQNSLELANGIAAPAGVAPRHSMQAARPATGGWFGKPISPWITTAPTAPTYPPGLQGGGTLAPPIEPMPLPPIPRPRFPDWWSPAWRALRLDGTNFPGGGGGGGGKDYRRCMEA